MSTPGSEAKKSNPSGEAGRRAAKIKRPWTLGPWHIGYRVQDSDGDGSGFDICSGGLRMVRVTRFARVFKNRDNWSDPSLQTMPYPKARANAKLVCKTPDMAEALQQIYDCGSIKEARSIAKKILREIGALEEIR
jgi:hypothetical protein